MTRTAHFISTSLLLLFILLSCYGCSSVTLQPKSPLKDQLITAEFPETSPSENSDSSCSYFYFLWGTHAENNQLYVEAEEAYEKALICDPDSHYILRRLPILLIRMGKQKKAEKLLRTSLERFPDDIQDRRLLARLHIQNNEIDKAIIIYKELIEISPEEENYQVRLGILYSEQRQYVTAEQTFQKVLLLNKSSIYAHLYLARLAKQKGHIKLAEKRYKKALKLNWSTELALEFAEFYQKEKQFKKAEQQFHSILKKNPQETRAGLSLVQILLLQEKDTEALLILQDLRNKADDPVQFDMITARLHLRSGKLDKAVAILTPMTVDEDAPEASYMLAIIFFQQNKFDQALQLLHTIEEEAPQFEDSIYLQVRIFIEQQQYTNAIDILIKTLKNEALATPGIYSLLASLYLEQHEMQKGYELLDEAILKYPDSDQIHFEYGLMFEEDNAQEKAIPFMEKVVLLNPEHAEALNYLGYTWADKNIHLEKALQYVQKAILLKPGNGYILDSLGWVYFRMGKLDLAKKEILKALKLEPEDPNIYEHLGDIYLKQGLQKEALKAFETAVALFSKVSDKKRILTKIQNAQ